MMPELRVKFLLLISMHLP